MGRKTAVCPRCSSDQARFSRRHYDGPWSLLFRVLPVRCSHCGIVFPIARGGSILRPQRDPVDLHLPFRPSELDATYEPEAAPAQGGPLLGLLSRPSRPACPTCGSPDIRPSRPESNPLPSSRLDVGTTYRCVRCNASFRRNSAAKLVTLALVLLAVLAGLSYLTLAALRASGRPGSLPTIRKDQVKQPPPPVFR